MEAHIHGSIDSCVSPQAEGCAWDVVADGGGDDAHGDAELVIATPGLHQLQRACVRLRGGGRGVTEGHRDSPGDSHGTSRHTDAVGLV